jgi:glc operon protein GlcG
MSVMKTALFCLVAFAATPLTSPASAQDVRPSYGTTVNLATAKKLANSAIIEAQKNNWNIAVAIVDNHGLLVYYEMMDDTQTGSAGVAIDKARSAAMFRRPTRAFEEAINKGGRPSVLNLSGASAISGGMPVTVGGKIVGGIGVSGASADQDEQVAKAGLQAVQ